MKSTESKLDFILEGKKEEEEREGEKTAGRSDWTRVYL